MRRHLLESPSGGEAALLREPALRLQAQKWVDNADLYVEVRDLQFLH